MSTTSTTSSPLLSLDEISSAGWPLHAMFLHYSLILLCILIILASLSSWSSLRNSSGTFWERIRIQFVLESWPKLVRDWIGMSVLVFAVVPFSLTAISLLFGGVVSATEGWPFTVGFEYVLSGVSGVSIPLVDVTPRTTAGEVLDIVLSLWAMLLSGYFMGVTGGMSAVGSIISKMPDSSWAFFRYLLIYVPVLLLSVALATGTLVALAEEWSVADGFLFMISSLCGLSTPLVPLSPETPTGIFIEVLAIIFEVTIGGAVISITGAHPICGRLIARLEGEVGREVTSHQCKKMLDHTSQREEKLEKTYSKHHHGPGGHLHHAVISDSTKPHLTSVLPQRCKGEEVAEAAEEMRPSAEVVLTLRPLATELVVHLAGHPAVDQATPADLPAPMEPNAAGALAAPNATAPAGADVAASLAAADSLVQMLRGLLSSAELRASAAEVQAAERLAELGVAKQKIMELTPITE